jgi:hypothetical protein
MKTFTVRSSTSTNLVVEWFSMRYQAAEKFSLVKSALIPWNSISKFFWGNLLLQRKKELKYVTNVTATKL